MCCLPKEVICHLHSSKCTVVKAKTHPKSTVVDIGYSYPKIEYSAALQEAKASPDRSNHYSFGEATVLLRLSGLCSTNASLNVTYIRYRYNTSQCDSIYGLTAAKSHGHTAHPLFKIQILKHTI